jgi:hypothetical protein
MLLAVCLCAIVLSATCLADSKVLTTGAALDIRIEGEQPVMMAPLGPTVRGSIQVTPAPIKPVCDRLVFYVDDAVALATTGDGPRLLLDTNSLKDGEHALRIEAERGGRLVMSTGAGAIRVANTEGSAVAGVFETVPTELPSPPFEKLYRAQLTHEAIWFNGLEVTWSATRT